MLHGTSKACCYTALLKLVAIRHLKAHCYTTLLQSLLLHGNIFHKISNCLQKPKYYLGNYLQNPNIILATIYKSRMLFWQLFTKNPNYFGNFILASSIKKKRKKIQNYWANNYFTKAQMLFGKRIILCLKPKTILWQKHILIYKIPKLMGSINCLWHITHLVRKLAWAIVWRILAPIYLFVGLLAIQQVEPRAPTSQSKLYASLENPFWYTYLPFFVVLLPLCLLTLPSILCVLPPFLVSTSISCVFAVFLLASFLMFSQYFSQCFSANPLFSFFSLFYSLSLVGHSSLSFDQFTRIFTFARIPRNHHAF